MSASCDGSPFHSQLPIVGGWITFVLRQETLVRPRSECVSRKLRSTCLQPAETGLLPLREDSVPQDIEFPEHPLRRAGCSPCGGRLRARPGLQVRFRFRNLESALDEGTETLPRLRCAWGPIPESIGERIRVLTAPLRSRGDQWRRRRVVTIQGTSRCACGSPTEVP